MAEISAAAKDAARRGILSARWVLCLHRPAPELKTIEQRRRALTALSRINPPTNEGPRS